MKYKVILHPSAAKFLKKLPNIHANRIKKKLMAASEDPYIYFEHLEDIDFYKLRVGKFRIIVDIIDSRHLIKVYLIGKRDDIYKKLGKTKF